MSIEKDTEALMWQVQRFASGEVSADDLRSQIRFRLAEELAALSAVIGQAGEHDTRRLLQRRAKVLVGD